MRDLISNIGGTDYAAFAITGVIVLIFTLVYLWWNEQSAGKLSCPGLSSKDETLGNLGMLTKDGGLHQFLLDNHKKMGPIFSFYWGKELVVSLGAPNLWKDVQMLFDRPTNQYDLFKPLIGASSIQYINAPHGRKHRQLHDRYYSFSAIGSYFSKFTQIGEELVKSWSKVNKEEMVPLRQHMIATALKSILRTSFGSEHLKTNKEILKFQQAYDVCWREMEIRLGGDFPQADSKRMKDFDENLLYMKKITKEILDCQRKLKASGIKSTNFLDILIEDESLYENDDQICDMIITYIIGGFHTTGNLLTWVVYFICQHPEVEEKLMNEINQLLTGGETLKTVKQCEELKYMKQVIDESLRCSVLAPYAARYSDYDIVVGGHIIPKQTPIILALGAMLYNEKTFPQPSRFDPDRFSEENSKKRHPLAFQPFGFAGKRKCPGYRFAYYEVFAFLTAMLQNYKISLVEGKPVEMVHSLVTQPKEEIWVSLEPRKK